MAGTEKGYLNARMDMEVSADYKYSVGIYSRLSVDHEDKKTESIDNQIEIIRQFIASVNGKCGKHQELVVYDTYVDCGISGTSFEREGFNRLMKDVRSHRVDCIIVKDLSRLGRDYLETGNYIEKIFPLLGVRFIAVTDGFDSMAKNASERKLAMNIKNLVNDMYAKDISQKVMTARKAAAKKGAFIGSIAPFGYDTAVINGIRKLVVHPQSAEIVRYLFQCYAAGDSFHEIVSSLYKKKIHRISDYKKYGHNFYESGELLHQWNESTVKGVLSNPVYCGKLVQCQTKSMLQERKKGVCHTGEKQWVTVKNSHESIVETELFDKVNAALNLNKKGTAVMSTLKEDENIFRNILYCGNCGGKMHAAYYQSRIDGNKSYSYHCRKAYYMDERKCSKNYIREDELEFLVAEQIKKILDEQKLTAKKLTAMNRLEFEKKTDSYWKEQNKILIEKQKLIEQAGIMYMQYKENHISREEYKTFMENKTEYDGFCEKRRKELKRKIRKSGLRAEEENQFLRSLKKVHRCRKLTVYFVEAMIEKMMIAPDGTLTICFRFQNGGACDAKE